MIRIRQKGDFSKATRYFQQLQGIHKKVDLNKYGRAGVEALASATPIESGETANSWYYEINYGDKTATLIFYNSNVQNGVPIAIILQYGHGTRNGGYVEGIDYINPALKPVFDQLAEDAWREVTNL